MRLLFRFLRVGAIAALALALGTCVQRPGLLEQIETLGTLRVATVNSATTYYLDVDGPAGFEYDLAHAFADELGLALDVMVVPDREAVLTAVTSGRAHIGVGLAVSDARRQRVRFTPIYAETPLEVVYNGVAKAISGVSLSVPERGVAALLGPNGAGKTTILRAITGLLPLHEGAITKGEIKLGELPLTRMAPERIVRNGLLQVMEGRRIFIELSVEENLLAGTYSRRDDARQDMAAMYERFPRLAERRKQTAGLLSGGEQQMLAIARALLAKPKVLLLDEPSLGLSPAMTAQVAEVIASIRDAGVSVLLVEQNAAMALDLAEHGYILENGKLVLDGPAAELRDDPDVREFYLGVGGEGRKSFADVKRYQRRKRWLS